LFLQIPLLALGEQIHKHLFVLGDDHPAEEYIGNGHSEGNTEDDEHRMDTATSLLPDKNGIVP